MNTRTVASRGLALISVLLLLTVMLMLAAAAQQLVLLTALTTRNQHTLAVAEAEQHTKTTLALRLLETQVTADGELPETALLGDGTSYTRLTEQQALIVIAGNPPTLASELSVELDAGRVRIVAVR